MNVYIESPLTTSYMKSLECLIQSSNHEAPLEHHKWNPRKLMGYVLNIILRDYLNGVESPLVIEVKDVLPKEHEYLTTLAREINEQVNDALSMGCGIEIEYLVKEVKFMESMIFLDLEVNNEL